MCENVIGAEFYWLTTSLSFSVASLETTADELSADVDTRHAVGRKCRLVGRAFTAVDANSRTDRNVTL